MYVAASVVPCVLGRVCLPRVCWGVCAEVSYVGYILFSLRAGPPCG